MLLLSKNKQDIIIKPGNWCHLLVFKAEKWAWLVVDNLMLIMSGFLNEFEDADYIRCRLAGVSNSDWLSA